MNSALAARPVSDRATPTAPHGAHDHPLSVIARISTLNVLLKRRAAIYAKRTYNLTMIEWRIATLLLVFQPISIRELSAHALADAAQISRGAAALAKKGYLQRQRSPLDNREILLSLTPRGKALSITMSNASLARNDELVEGRPREKVEALVALLDELIVRARSLVEGDESAEPAPPAPTKKRKPQARKA
jgi:DNA-binding MarR family transcriptional regulator